MISNIDAPMASRTSTNVTFVGQWLANRRGLLPTALALTESLSLSNRTRQGLNATALTAWNLSKRSRRCISLARCSSNASHTQRLVGTFGVAMRFGGSDATFEFLREKCSKIGRIYVIRSPIFPRHIAQAFSSCKVKRAQDNLPLDDRRNS